MEPNNSEVTSATQPKVDVNVKRQADADEEPAAKRAKIGNGDLEQPKESAVNVNDERHTPKGAAPVKAE